MSEIVGQPFWINNAAKMRTRKHEPGRLCRKYEDEEKIQADVMHGKEDPQRNRSGAVLSPGHHSISIRGLGISQTLWMKCGCLGTCQAKGVDWSIGGEGEERGGRLGREVLVGTCSGGEEGRKGGRAVQNRVCM